MSAKDADGSIAMSPPRILHVAVINPFLERADEFHIVHPLVPQVRWIVVKAKALMPPHRLYRALGRSYVESDFGRVHFECKVHVHLVKLIENRPPPVREIIKPLLPIFLIRRRKGIDRMPDA